MTRNVVQAILGLLLACRARRWRVASIAQDRAAML
jgi:hypothetical protein